MPDAETLDLDLPNGRVRAERTGPADAPLTLLVHGLSQNLRAWDWTVPALAREDRQVVALDLRGRGASDTAPPYGPDAHVEDLAAIADRLGHGRPIHYVGWSMGALLGIRLAGARPGLIDRLVLVDHAGFMDEGALDAVKAGLARLDATVPAPEPYLDAVRATGVFAPWTEGWDRFFRYELGDPDPDAGTYRPRTSRTFCTADVTEGVQDDFRARWPHLTMPVLLLHATQPLGGGLIVPHDELAKLREAVLQLEVLTVDRNHYTVLDDPAAPQAIARFLDAG